MSADDAGLRVSDYVSHMLDAARLARDGDQQADCVNIPSVIPAAFRTASACRKASVRQTLRPVARKCYM